MYKYVPACCSSLVLCLSWLILNKHAALRFISSLAVYFWGTQRGTFTVGGCYKCSHLCLFWSSSHCILENFTPSQQLLHLKYQKEKDNKVENVRQPNVVWCRLVLTKLQKNNILCNLFVKRNSSCSRYDFYCSLGSYTLLIKVCFCSLLSWTVCLYSCCCRTISGVTYKLKPNSTEFKWSRLSTETN